jgi:hypothetical protein
MAAPNLTSPSAIYGKSVGATLTTSLASVLSNAAASGKVLKINTIRVANTTVSSATVDISFRRSSTDYYLLKGGSISANTTTITTDKNDYLYLEEGDELWAKASAATTIDITVNYEELS